MTRFQRFRSRRSLVLVLAPIVALALTLQLPTVHGQIRGVENVKELRGADLPTFYLVHHYFERVVELSERNEPALAEFLHQTGIISPSVTRDVVLREARLGLSMYNQDVATRSSTTLAAAKGDPQVARERWIRDREGVAREMGKCFGRILARISETGRRPEAFEDILHGLVGTSMTLHYSEEPGALAYIRRRDAAFRSGVNSELFQVGQP